MNARSKNPAVDHVDADPASGPIAMRALIPTTENRSNRVSTSGGLMGPARQLPL